MRPNEIGQAKAELERAKPDLAQLKADYERDRDLFLKQHAISQLDYELAESKYRQADQHLHSLEFALEMLESSRGNKVAAAEADVRAGRGRPGHCPMEIGQLQDPRPDRRHDPEKER